MMNLPEPIEVTPRIAPRAPEQTTPADKDPKVTGKLDKLEVEETPDSSFVEELALAIGAVNPFQNAPLLPWTSPETSSGHQDTAGTALQVERPEPAVVTALPVFFAIPPSEVKVSPTDLLAQTPHLAPPAVPQWVAGEVRRFQQGDQTMTQLSIQLDPPDLGKLQLTLTMVDQKVAVELAVSSHAKPHIEESLAGIRQILASSNLATKEIKVTTSANPKDPSRQDAYPQQNRWARRRSSDDDNLSVKA